MGAESDAESLLAAARALWPDPGRATIARGRRRRGDAAGGREFLLLPSAARPRVLLPAGAPRAAAAVARRASSLTSARDRAIRTLVSTLARTGLADRVVRDRLRVEVAPGSEHVESVLAGVLGEPVLVSLAVGTARANRKPILQVLTPAGATVAYVKVGDTDEARRLVDGEADALTRLAAVDFAHLRVPRVLHHGTWGGLRLLVLSPVGTGAGRRDDLPGAAMGELARAGAVPPTPVRETAFWARLVATAAVHPRLATALDRAERRWGDAEVETGWSHGDWTPWNMAWVDDAVHVWDWERFETSSPVGLDALHFRMQHVAQRGGDWVAALATLDADAPGLLGAVRSADHPATAVDLYLLDLACRYVEASAGPLGVHLADRAAWLLGVVEGRLV